MMVWWGQATPSWKIGRIVNWDDDINPIFLGKCQIDGNQTRLHCSLYPMISKVSHDILQKPWEKQLGRAPSSRWMFHDHSWAPFFHVFSQHILKVGALPKARMDTRFKSHIHICRWWNHVESSFCASETMVRRPTVGGSKKMEAPQNGGLISRIIPI